MIVERLVRGFFGQVDDQVDHRLDLLVRKGHRTQHFGLRKLVSFGFDHHHRVLGACDNQIKALIGVVPKVLHVVDGRVQNVVAILETNAGPGDRAHEGRAGKRQCRRGGDHRYHVGVIDQIVGKNRADHKNFVLEPRHEQGADRTVDQARGQRFLLGRPRFTLEEAAGDFACGVIFLVIMDG